MTPINYIVIAIRDIEQNAKEYSYVVRFSCLLNLQNI